MTALEATTTPTELAPARWITHGEYSGYANEVGLHNPDLEARVMENPIACFVFEFIERDDRHPTPELHLDIWDLMIYENRVVVTAPRSFGKTTCCRNFVLFLICYYLRILRGDFAAYGIFPHTRIRIMSASGDKAREILDQIKEELDNNDLLRTEFGVFDAKVEDVSYKFEGKKWTERHLTTAHGVEITAAGRGAQVRGFRPTLLILDDLDDDEEVQSDERLEKAFSWFDRAVFNTIDEDEYQVFAIGTLLEETSLLNYIGNKPSFKHITYRAYIDNIRDEGWEAWPSKWSHKRLQVRLLDIGYKAFMSEFQGQPQPSDNPLFERNWFREYDPNSSWFHEELRLGFFTILWIDPAISKKDKSDYTALVTMSVTFDKIPKIYLRTGGVLRGHFTPRETVNKGVNTYDAFYCNELGIETTAYQMALKYLFDEEAEINRRSFSIQEMAPDEDKERRANAVSPMVQRGQVYYDPKDPMHLKLIDECVLFKPGKTNIKKDLMDAFVHGLTRVRSWSQTRREDGDAGQVLPGNRRTHSRTGI